MTQTQSVPAKPFEEIVSRVVSEGFSPAHLDLVPRGLLEAYAFRALETPLVYLVNERRVELRLDGETPEEQYLCFVRDAGGVLAEVRERFPGHWRHWEEIRACLTNAFETIVRQAASDSTTLWDLLGERDRTGSPAIVSIEPMGDVHPQGVVCRVVTSTGAVYYKPRPAGNETFLAALGEWMSERSEAWLGLRFPDVADCGDHMWVAPVKHEPLARLADAKQYYRRAGQLLGLAYLVNITDLHHENIVATATQPVPVDLETIMSVLPRAPRNQPDATDATLRQTTMAPAGTGLIPLGTTFPELGGDISGFGAEALRVRHRKLDRLGRSDMRYTHAVTEFVPDKNRPTHKGAPVPPAEYVDDIVEGFATALRIGLRHRDELVALIEDHAGHLHVRVLARMTNDYTAVLAGLSRVGSATEPERLFRLLRRKSAGLAETMVDSEEAQLRRWSVPHFWAMASETTIRDPWGHPTGQLDVAPVAQTVAKIRSLEESSIDREVSLVRLAFRGLEEIVLPLGRGLAPRGQGSFEAFERAYFDALHAQAVRGADGSINWPVLAVDERDQLTVQPLVGGTYRGVAGVAELLAASRFSGARWSRTAEALLRTLRLETEPLLDDEVAAMTYYHGPAGRLAAARRLSLAYALPTPWIQPYYERFLETLETAEPSTRLDVLEGQAGTIIALRRSRDPRVRALCERLGRRLMAAASDGWGSQNVCGMSRNASFAHDSGGMGTSLLIVAGMTGDLDMVDGWRGAWEFENTFKIGEGWKDARSSGEHHSIQWCHGLAGIALARSVWLHTISQNDSLHRVVTVEEIVKVRAELEEAAELLARDLGEDGSPSLCHGIAGGALVLDRAGRLLGRRDWRDTASDLIARAGATLSRCPWMWGEHDARDFGIMTGPGGLILARALLRWCDGQVGPLLPDLGDLGETA